MSIASYRRKSSIQIRGVFGTSTSVYSDDHWVSSVTLENLKDRAVTIFGIYLQLGHHHYLDIQEFGEKPLILKPYESWHKEYGPVDFYAVNTRKISLEPLFTDHHVKKRLVLSVGEGKYVITEVPRPWEPVHDYFRNYMTVPVYPQATYYKGEALGSKALFVIDFIDGDGNSHPVPIYPDDGNKKFAQFSLTPDAIKSAAALKKYLQARKRSGKLKFHTFDVIDVADLRRDDDIYAKTDPIEAKAHSLFIYRVVAPAIMYYRKKLAQRKSKKGS
ncbi:MAG: hypothetical protein JO314_08580 [Acidobacteria bacterium]|nr:hypothetical protein [Acidobacteriota bacterium]